MDDILSDHIFKYASCLERINPEDKYNKSYYHFVRFFSEKDILTEHDLIIGANFSYGWMPTILNFKSDNFPLAVSILNKAKGDERISGHEILALKNLVNNSLVGASKLLHFVNPNEYAIWDSRVCNFLTGKSYREKVEKIELFTSYLDLCKRITSDKSFMAIHEKNLQKIGFEFSPMRTVEQIMFISSNEPLSR